MKSMPNRKEREEIDTLSKQLKKLEEELKIKDQRNKLTIERLKKQIAESKEKNEELIEERNNIYVAVKGTSYDGQINTYESPDYTTENQNNVQNSKGSKGNLNFYEPMQDYTEEKHEVDLNNISHSPQFGVRKSNGREDYEEAKYYNENKSSENEEPQDEDHSESNPENDQAENDEDELNTSDYEMKFLDKYHNDDDENKRIIQENISSDGKIVRWYANQKKEIIFRKGVRKEIFPDGYTIVYFKNQDIKQTYPDGKIVYYFWEARTTQTTETNGINIFKFDSNQIEKHFPDGTKEIRFSDGTIKWIFADGEEEWVFPDGSIQTISKDGVKTIEYRNGTKEVKRAFE